MWSSSRRPRKFSARSSSPLAGAAKSHRYAGSRDSAEVNDVRTNPDKPAGGKGLFARIKGLFEK